MQYQTANPESELRKLYTIKLDKNHTFPLFERYFKIGIFKDILSIFCGSRRFNCSEKHYCRFIDAFDSIEVFSNKFSVKIIIRNFLIVL